MPMAGIWLCKVGVLRVIYQHIVGCTVLLSAVVGCGTQPPSVESSADVDSLPASTRSVAARMMPDDQIVSLERLKELEILDFTRGRKVGPAEITDAGLAKLAQLNFRKLDTLTLGWCEKISDAGLDDLARIEHITWLGLPSCNITDAGLPKLTASASLTDLDLRGCEKITDAGIQQLAAKKDWKLILLGGCPRVTQAGVAKLQAALPDTRVDKDDQEWKWSNE
jgi:hypothetical protein